MAEREQAPRRKKKEFDAHNSFMSFVRVKEISPDMNPDEALDRIQIYEAELTRMNESITLRQERDKRLSNSGLKPMEWHLFDSFYEPVQLVEGDEYEDIKSKNIALIASSLPPVFQIHTETSLSGKLSVSENPLYWEVYVKKTPPQQ